MQRISLRQLGFAAIVLFVLIASAQIALPCHVWRWPVAGIFIVSGTFALLVVTPKQREHELDPTARGFAIWLSQAWVISGIIAASGLLC